MSDADLDFAELAPTGQMQRSAFVLMVGGIVRLSVGIQLLAVVRLGGRWWWVPYAMVGIGMGLTLLGALSGRGRVGAAWAAALVVPVVAVVGLAWEVYAIPRGLLSPLSVVAAGMGLVGGVLAPLALGPTRRIAALRRKLLS